MRRFGDQPPSPLAPTGAPRSDWGTLRRLFPYLWRYKWRVMVALAFMVGAKLANVGVPLLLKQLVDAMTPGMNPATAALLVVPVGLLLAYGGLRLCTTLFTELRELVFAKATQGAARSIALETFQHLHALSLRFHLERQTGGMTRDIERGVRGIESLISYSLFSIVPTLIEVVMVLTILGVKFDAWFAWITLASVIHANQASNFTPRMVSTITTSISVGTMLNSEYEISDSMPRTPRSMSRVMPPVWRSR